ncbi:hypothetical protein N7E81_18650 [Reichenbachiella carrageenanivorans]|uniref:DUF5689 domain-containing protein n=1 Tax=Reichenbachiella carrageenanivorans TaxID=2979869 RepID=A0ABY6CZP1_9BACT|nr:hypothetical protein [Reichenbachiella carrageenanivorans]UXX79375.1 hypothetical protein N7E81_18650 [Reichenbachiella carrageenanivorans]
MKKYINNRVDKHLKLLTLGLMVLVAGSCEEDIEPKGTNPSHRVFYTNQATNDNTVNVGGRIDFADVSQGVTSREWSFPESAELEGTTTDAQVSAFFTEAGSFQVGLHQEFSDSAYAERGVDKLGMVLDTVLNVTVLPLVDVTKLSAKLLNRDGSLGADVKLESESQTEIFAGSTLRFSYEAIGDPTDITGVIDGGALSNADVVNHTFDVKFGGLDTYDLTVFFKREQPVSTDTVAYTNFIKTISSPDPVSLISIYDKEGKIAVEYSRDLLSSSVSASDFTAEIATKAGPVITPVVSGAALDPDNGAVVLLTLKDDEVYSDDEVTVSFKAGTLMSADIKAADAFTDQDLEHQGANLFADSNWDYGFEQTTAVDWVDQDVYGWLAANDNFTAVTSTTQVHEGTVSMKITVDAGNGPTGIMPKNASDGSVHTFTTDNEIQVRQSAWVYVESAPAGGNCLMRLRMAAYQFPWGQQTPMCAFTDGSGGFATALPIGEWVQIEQIFTANITASEGVPTMIISPVNSGATDLVFYLDDMVLEVWNPRP